MFIADLHVHSHFSDGVLSIPELIDFFGQRGIGAIAITDHICEESTFLGRAARFLEKTLTPKTFPKYIEIIEEEKERAWRLYKMLVIPGYELSKNSISNYKSAHMLALGTREFMWADADALQLTRQIRNAGGVSVAAHPVSTGMYEKQTYYLWNRREELRHEFDAWEVASGKVFFKEVYEAKLPLLANSDLHHPNQFNSWKTVFECEKSEEAILDAIRKQQLSFKNLSYLSAPSPLKLYGHSLSKA